MEGMTPARARSRRRWARWFAALAGLLVVAYAGLIGYLLANERALIFRPPRTLALVAGSLRLEPESIELTTRGGVRTVAWRVRSLHPSPHWMLYLHGNAATIRSGGNVQRYHQLRSLGINVLAPEYPGFGSVAGEPSENGVRESARAAYDHLRRDLAIAPEHIVIYGWSLGSGGAVALARDVEEAALVVEGAFSSVLRRAQASYPFLPIALMVHHPFLSEDAIAETRSPTLFLHSPEDLVIPYADGRRLYDRAREPKQLVPLRGGHITPNLDDEDRYLAAIAGVPRRARTLDARTSEAIGRPGGARRDRARRCGSRSRGLHPIQGGRRLRLEPRRVRARTPRTRAGRRGTPRGCRPGVAGQRPRISRLSDRAALPGGGIA